MQYFSLMAMLLASMTSSVSAIIGGGIVPGNEYNFAVAILQPALVEQSTSFICSGVLISPNYVLTIAKCVMGLTASEVSVRTGKVASTYYTHDVSNIIVHPKYNSSDLENDVALLQLKQPATKMSFAQLDANTTYPTGECIDLIGWGPTKTRDESIATYLHSAKVDVVKEATCASMLKSCYKLDPMQHFCTNNTSKREAYGDAGGPVIDEHGKLVGLISGDPVCAGPDGLALEVMVGHFYQWIRNNMK